MTFVCVCVTLQALTIAYPAFLKAEDTQLPIWIIILAVIGALIILVVIIIILWKVSWFIILSFALLYGKLTETWCIYMFYCVTVRLLQTEIGQ